jgi:hypothetical protein
MKRLVFAAGLILLAAASIVTVKILSSDRVAVIYPQKTEPLEEFSAREIQRYVYLRTGILAELIRSDELPDGYDHCFIVGNKGQKLFHGVKDSSDIIKHSGNLERDEFFIKTYSSPHGKRHIVCGGNGTGTLYGTYRLMESIGVRYNIDGDALPDEKFNLGFLAVNETGKSRFSKRGLQPFHDFNVGPDWWNLNDYKSVLSQMVKLRLNFIGFHTYPSWNPSAGPEANVWIGLSGDVDAEGNVSSGYEAGVVTTRRGWEVRPFPTGEYASGAALLFEGDDYGPDFMLNCLEWPKNENDAAAMFNRYGDFQKNVFNNAGRLGINTCVGTELPLGIPPMLASKLKSSGMDPGNPEVIGKLYEGTFLRLMRKMPVDYFWFWLPEIWLGSEPGCRGWEITTEKNVKRDLKLIESAAENLRVPFRFATSGWRLGTLKDPLWTDRYTPAGWAISSINTSVGRDPVEKYYGEIKNRPKWAIGWAEDDGAAGAHCCTAWDVQLWVERMFANSSDAFHYGCEGMMAIHWRTASIAPNICALSQAGWQYTVPENENQPDSVKAPDMNLFWEDWGKGQFGGETGTCAGRIIQKLDGSHISLNRLIDGGCRTTDKDIYDLFTPVAELRAIRKNIRGTGNLNRFDYWLNYLDASMLRVRTWVLSARLDSVMLVAGTMQSRDDRSRLIKESALPLRISLARSWEEMIAAYLNCAKSTGEVGTITSIESGNRQRIVNSHDIAIEGTLGTPLPAEASIKTSYNGPSRIFLSSECTQTKKGEPLEIRPFVLSAKACNGVNLYWRPLGRGEFSKLKADHQARQAFRVTLPAINDGCVEYYLEAEVENGEKIFYPVTAPAVNMTSVIW